MATGWKTAVFLMVLSCLGLSGCNAVSQSADPPGPCTIAADVTPASATADHSLSAPGNQALFTATSTVTGNCPLTPDFLGSWSTSDPINTGISSQPAMQATATCLHATTTPATISYSGTVRGHTFNSATLSCK